MNTSTNVSLGRRTNRLKSSQGWAEHFGRDLQRDWTIPWALIQPLPETARRRIAASIAEFQRGESSEARGYLGKSEKFSAHANDPAFQLASERFVGTENAHAALLLRYMERTRIPQRKSSALDGVFRWLRGLSDLGWSSRVILIAELIAQEYYPCLRAATADPALIRICDRIIAEEAVHIRFQLERIVRIEAAHRDAQWRWRDFAHALLMSGTIIVVFAGHHRVLTTRLSFEDFFSRSLGRFRRAVETMHQLRSSARFCGDAARSPSPGRGEATLQLSS